ncbi:MAG: hypothetical protein K0R00_308 [Herbinix sp.]|jgi:LPXTG-motif cell wall-anchored protein|nr:hypothetical protein [Herbinix sp.]
MKNGMKKVMAVLAVALICVGFYAPVVSAETSTVVIHAKDGQAWGSLNVYNWGDNGETAGVWPGAAMTAEADGWYTYTFETEVPLNLVFSAQGGSPQSSNIEGLAVDAKEVWVVIGGEGEANDMGASTNEAVLYLTAEEGWPTVAVAEEAAEEVVTEEAVTEAADVPKTGESIALAVAFLAIAGLSVTGFVVLKKKATA